jgi:hypothetical protein
MNQKPLLTSTTHSKPTLKPELAAALASLEVQLDQELARYRRTRNTSRTPSQVRVKPVSQKEQLTTINSTANNKPAAVTITSSPQQESTPNKANIPSVSVPNTHIEVPPIPSPPPSEVTTETLSSGNASIVPTVVAANQNDTPTMPPEPDDYLESSEALLRSLTEEPQQKRANNNDSLLSPLGIGSMLLLLVASLTLGYVIFNPQSLSLFSFGTKSSSSKVNTDVSNKNTTQPQQQLTPVPKYPNLATDEFPEVNNPNDVVNLKPKARPTPTPLPIPTSPAQPLQEPSTVNTTPTPTPIPLAEIKPSADGFYHVVIDNQGSDALAQARKVVPDAYLSPDGKLIYVGALKTQEEVEKQLQQLLALGIKARIQQP